MSNEQQQCRQIVLPDVPSEVTDARGPIWARIFDWYYNKGGNNGPRGASRADGIDSAIISAMRDYATEAVRQDRASRPVGALDREEVFAAIKTLQGLGYTWNGGELWKPPVGQAKPAPDADGWIEWKGGACPVGSETPVYIKMRSGITRAGSLEARRYRWSHIGSDGDIVAYRVLGEYRAPDATPAGPVIGQTWWVSVKGSDELTKALIISISDQTVAMKITDSFLVNGVTAYRRSAVEFVEVCNG